MPVVTEWPDFFANQSLEKWQALNCSRTLQPRFLREVAEMHAYAKMEKLIQPRLAYGVHAIQGISADSIELENGHLLPESTPIIKKFKKAEALLLVLCTIGEKLEQTVAKLFKEKKALKALALEEISVFAMFEFTNTIIPFIDTIADGLKLQVSSPLYPGGDEFDIAHQRHIQKLAGGAGIGMQIMKTDMLYPAKSASMVFGLGQKMPRWDRHKDCETCKARDRCQYRAQGKLAGEAT